MNPVQLALQLRHLLRAVRWTGGAQDLVFGAFGDAVTVSQGPINETQIPPRVPFAVVHIDSGEHDPDDPGLLRQNFVVAVAAGSAGDPMGQFAIIGGPTDNLGKSANRGVGEVAERARAAVQALSGHDGVRVQLSAESIAPVQQVLPDGRHIVFSAFECSAQCTSAPHYQAPQLLAASGGTWSWNGTGCSTRFDFITYHLVRKAGTSPSTSPADGTIVYSGTTPSFVGAATAGNTYTVFAEYNARRSTGIVEGYSSPVVGSYRVVT